MKIAIIGVGPRGLHALERFVYHISKLNSKENIKIILFEKSEMAGYGHVYDINQADTNWINITERALKDLKGREAITLCKVNIPMCEAYCDSEFAVSCDNKQEYPDIFPKRSSLGKYLKYRFNSLVKPLINAGIVTLVKKEIIHVLPKDGKVDLQDSDGDFYLVDEVLLTIGHQSTEEDVQLEGWRKNIQESKGSLLIEKTYPIKNIQEKVVPFEHIKIGIRGFGLAAIDAIRALVELYNGNFEASKENMEVNVYNRCKIDLQIVVFSLDGLPPVPKPYSPAIDSKFKPSDSQLAHLEERIQAFVKSKPLNHLLFVHEMANLICELYIQRVSDSTLNLAEINIALVEWILNDKYAKGIMTDPEMGVLEMIKLHIRMAEGKEDSNLDFFAGQVWRHCQPTLYRLLSHSRIPDLIMTSIIKIDEKLKRYSYGPPVASMKQLMLLAEANTLNLDFVENPKIVQHSNGWLLDNDGNTITVSCMINSVIDSPQIKKINSPLLKNLLSNEIIEPVHHEFGINTREDGQIITPESGPRFPIYLLGRMAKGSVIGVDAILECFGDRVDKWAEACAERINKN